MNSSLLITGSIAIDTIRTPGGAAADQLGGSATFAALAGKHWTKPLILSAIGADFPLKLEKRLATAGLVLKKLTRDVKGKSFRWEGIYDEGLGTRRTIGVDLGVMAGTLLHIPAEIKKIRFAMMATYAPERQMEIVKHLPADCFIATDTIAIYINTSELRPGLDRLVKKSSLIAFDLSELLAFTGQINENLAVKKIFELGPRWVIVKYGEGGSRLYSADGQTATMGIYKTVAKDTTGAGDTFLGTIMAHLAAMGKADFPNLLRGMRLGAAAASITVESFGVDALINTTKREIERRAKEIIDASGNF